MAFVSIKTPAQVSKIEFSIKNLGSGLPEPNGAKLLTLL